MRWASGATPWSRCGRPSRRTAAPPEQARPRPPIQSASRSPAPDMNRLINHLEEGFIALLLAAMTLLTFAQVVLRYVFNSGFVWGVEATTYMFAWLVLFGISYGIRVHAHIGIDLLVKGLPGAPRRWA